MCNQALYQLVASLFADWLFSDVSCAHDRQLTDLLGARQAGAQMWSCGAQRAPELGILGDLDARMGRRHAEQCTTDGSPPGREQPSTAQRVLRHPLHGSGMVG